MPNWFPYPLLSSDKFIKLCYCRLHFGPAARFLKTCCEREPGTVTNLLNDLNWHSLELRRKIARVTTMYKIENNKTRVNIPEYIARPTRVKRSYHSSKFINIGSNSNTCTIFFNRTLKEWNTLPSFLLDQPSMDAFKSAATNYFNLPHWFYTSFYCIIYLFIIIVIIIIYYYHYFFFISFFLHIHSECKLA